MIGQSPNDLIILLRTYFLLSIKNPVFPKEKENDDCNSSLYFSSDDENDEQNKVNQTEKITENWDISEKTS